MIEFNCPRCDKFLKTEDSRSGLDATCPGCGATITIPAALVERRDAENGPGGQSDNDPTAEPGLNRCAECSSELFPGDRGCRYCGHDLNQNSWERQGTGRHRETRPFPPGDVISEAAKIYGNQFWFCTLAALVSTALVIAVAVIVVVCGVVAVTFISNRGARQPESVEMLGLVALAVVVLVAGGAIAIFIQTGQMIVSLKVVRGEPVVLRDLFSGGRYLPQLYACTLIYWLMCVAAGLFFVIPAIMPLIMFLPFAYLQIDENPRGIGALTRARQMTKGNWGSLFLIVIVGVLCFYGGQFVPIVGGIISQAYLHILYALAYERMTYQTPVQQLASSPK